MKKIMLCLFLCAGIASANADNFTDGDFVNEAESPFYALDNLISANHLKYDTDYSNINNEVLKEYLLNNPRVKKLYKSKIDDSFIYTTADKPYSDRYIAYTEVYMRLTKTNLSPTGLKDSGLRLDVKTDNALICHTVLMKRRYLHNFEIIINKKKVDLDKINDSTRSEYCDYKDKINITAYYY